jgi:putative transposase
VRLIVSLEHQGRGQCKPGAVPELPCLQAAITELKQFNGEQDHVHLLVHYPPKAQLSKLVNSLKGVSSRRLRQEYDSHVHRYLWGGHFWSGSYFAGSCDGAPLTVVRQYIENQQRPTS